MQYLTGAAVSSIEPDECLTFSHHGSTLWVQTKASTVERYDLYSGQSNYAFSLTRDEFIQLKANELGVDILSRLTNNTHRLISVREKAVHCFTSKNLKIKDWRRNKEGYLVLLQDPPTQLQLLNDDLEVHNNHHCRGTNHLLLDNHIVWIDQKYLVLQNYKESNRKLWDQEWCPLNSDSALTPGNGDTLVLINRKVWVVLDAAERQFIYQGEFEVPFVVSVRLTYPFFSVAAEGVSWINLEQASTPTLLRVGDEKPISNILLGKGLLLLDYDSSVEVWNLAADSSERLRRIEGISLAQAFLCNRRFIYYFEDKLTIIDL